ncbi:alpha-D-ribose 1-methylphosphonate 5-triphosphate diphosphatase [Paracoccus liaowanqingii]|uniref:Alpha-D-ribose 1-methylphosphonate 5-triphosphate diphosphatase n=1 Tax=Paracoccus liaowanqingii TaxID=2560053 RepID=A0A4P7HJP8_9RHOB|nr:alpha-D-ribose 1-methylphosphonate 5-triphosphate diphosphatase [Paracoccus liaowanqingii]QBX34315.1 alpha-D-ribose 1-methylphosphonate 5-triphosphate diphosphatase [Paracoccus liaowanqingii]
MLDAANWILSGGTVLRDGMLKQGDLHLSGGVIAQEATAPQIFNARGLWILPGIVDVHGDAVERIVMPRPGVTFPLPLALEEADRQMLANGITTAFHGLTISWEPGLRSVATAGAFVEALQTAQLSCDTRINFRWESFAVDAADEVASWFAQLSGCVFSLNDHTLAHLGLPPSARKIVRMAERSGLTPDDCVTRLAAMAERAVEVPDAVMRMITAAQTAGMPMFAHDETSPAMREENRALGIKVSEFPMSQDTAIEARRLGEHVVFGAPNVLRGGSHNKAVDAGPAIAMGLGTVLASDYYYPAQLRAAFVLADHGQSFASSWDCVSASAAEAAGLSDRGRIETGLRADIIAVCPATRRVRAVFIAGERKLQID